MRHPGPADHSLIQHQRAILGQRADGELTVRGMADLADDQDVQGTEEDMGDFGSDNHTATRQTEDDISPNVLFAQVMAQSLAGIGA